MNRYFPFGILQRPQHFTDTVNTDCQNQEINTMEKAGNIAKNQTWLSGNNIQAYCGQHQTDQNRKNRFRNIVAP